MTDTPNLPAAAAAWPVFTAMSPAEQRAQLVEIAKLARAILSRFWTDGAEPDEFRIFEVETWQDVLRSVSPDEIRAAWADYQTTGPRTKAGALLRPDAGALFLRVMFARRRQMRQAVRPATTIPSQAVPPLTPPTEDMTKWRSQ